MAQISRCTRQGLKVMPCCLSVSENCESPQGNMEYVRPQNETTVDLSSVSVSPAALENAKGESFVLGRGTAALESFGSLEVLKNSNPKLF